MVPSGTDDWEKYTHYENSGMKSEKHTLLLSSNCGYSCPINGSDRPAP